MPALFVMAALTGADLLEQAEHAFADGLRRREAGQRSQAQFLEAARAYERLIQEGANNALVYRNLGNTYLLADDLPRAILAYRLGSRVAPSDPVLRDNLARVREQVTFLEGSALGRPAEEQPPVGGRGLFALSALAYLAGWLLLTRWWMVRREPLRLAGLVLLGLALAGAIVTWRDQAGRSVRPIVVLASDDVLLRKGNGLAFPPRYETPLHRGVEAELLHRSDGWLQIELSGREIGWVREADAVVEP